MTLFETISLLKKIAMKQPAVNSVGDGNIYESLNNNPSLKYGNFFITQETHQSDEDVDRYAFVIFFVDQLDPTLEDDRLRIQSVAKTVLSNVIRTFCEDVDIDYPVINFIPFTQKFVDETAGMYARLTLEIPVDYICEEIY